MNLTTLKKSMLAAAVVTAGWTAGSAHAATWTLDVSGILSNDPLGSAINETRSIYVGGGAKVIGISWDVALFADVPSWLSEMGVELSGEGGFLQLFPGFADSFPGFGTYADGPFDLIALGQDFGVGDSGFLNFEFFESFDDFPGDWDGIWERGTLTITTIPTPASQALAVLALLGLSAAMRRRKA